ncbi:MAG TPA: mercuric transporter MerT family protein [Thermoanaerobaculia bacterium]|nr:mercuric transporter MerT family protein [Thermoanaerobaculia bacterium]
MRKNVVWSLGGLVSAFGVFASWLCCLLPFTLGAAGVGVAAVGSRLEPYRPWLTGASIGFLGLAFYQAYRPRRACEADKLCAAPAGQKRQRLTLWVVLLIAVTLMAYPYLVGLYYSLK